MSTFQKFLPKSSITFLNEIFCQIDISKIMESIQTERPVIISEQVVEIDIIVYLGHALFVICHTKIEYFSCNAYGHHSPAGTILGIGVFIKFFTT